jgi:rod shape-determining protein MreC
MLKYFKSKVFIAFAAIALVCILTTAVFSAMGLTPILRNALGVVLTPFRYAATYVSGAFEGFSSYITDYNALVEENAALKKQLAEYGDKIYYADILESENEWLRGYLGIKREHTDLELDAALVIGRDEGNYSTLLTLNRGSANGVEYGMAVITEDGIVGKITEVGLTWSKVTPITETRASVGAYVERSSEVGVVEGAYDMRSEGLCVMSYVEAEADIVVGDRILSSGLGSVYPRGLLIGEVTELKPDKYGRTVVATIKPAADLANLSKVMIVTDYEYYSSESATEE